ncbi:MAG TPA: nucleotide exchange factor GrpE [bacterium]|nr:nucleotide exchange factor GrpE [bacterium]
MENNMERQETHDREINIPVSGPESVSEGASGQEKQENGSGPAREQDLVDTLRRLQAEFINYKRRVEREQDDVWARAQGEIVKQILPAMDDLERLIQHDEERGVCDVEGVRLISRKLQKVMADAGLQPVRGVGSSFDPEVHEAVGVVECQKEEDGMVMEEWERGYKLGDRLLRPGRVRVGRFKNRGE